MPESQPRKSKAVRSPSRKRRPSTPAPLSGQATFPVVGIGASAGGLDACTKLLEVLPADSGMAFIIVQHLDPTHESMMVNLLSRHTAMTVLQASEGMPIEPNHLYVIPPGAYLSVGEGALHLSAPQARHGARMPFDFLLHTLAAEFGSRAICVILSGTGADGSLGSKAVKEKGGFVIAQDPEEAGFDGMPRSAILTGAVDFVLPVFEIPGALAKFDRRIPHARKPDRSAPQDQTPDWLPEIIKLLRAGSAHDFSQYKPGTLQRRIERRMALAAIETDDMNRYLAMLRNDENELELLAKDLLINVTSFFRDPAVFDLLAREIVPALVGKHDSDHPLRIWIAGCSTGEESYSLAMLFREQITASARNVKLQVFASDIDADAVARAREGLYPESIKADVSPERLTRFFSKDGQAYRVSPELRAPVVFTVQDVLADPPFSRLDFVSCRNLLIYLRPEAQARAVSVFRFALREGGLLLLGGSETVDNHVAGFEVVSKSERLYRRVGGGQAIGFGAPTIVGDSGRTAVSSGQSQAMTRQKALAELCKQAVIENFAPAAVLINRNLECLYSLGPTDRYLRLARGAPSFDLLAMVRDEVRTKLRSAIQRVWKENTRIVIDGGQVGRNGDSRSFSIIAQPVRSEGVDLALVCFVDSLQREQRKTPSPARGDGPHVAELKEELETTRKELESAIRNLELSSEEQQAVNEEALSITEEYQSTNEELVTSKEELQSLNEELTALNSQLQETLELQRTTSNDLQNVLYSTDVATIFLDTGLKIRIYTPAATKLFNVIPSDVGRPLADLNALATDNLLLSDAQMVLQTHAPLEREIEADSGAWFIRRILPYRTQDGSVDGVVITFVDVTERKQISDTLEAANQQAQLATLSKSRFLAAASHDLRQPLQTLVLLQGFLAKAVHGESARELVTRLDQTITAMSSMLNTLLDINQIDAGAVTAERVIFPINRLLDRMKDAFAYDARAQSLALRVVPCTLSIESDPRLLEQIISNIVSNALKYTSKGKVLLGCRRREGKLSIEIWDTGVGIPENELQLIFDEYHQVDNAARERGRGLGLGLSIVRRLAKLLGYTVNVRSQLGKGSVFSIEVTVPPTGVAAEPSSRRRGAAVDDVAGVRRSGDILVVEDDREVRELLEHLLKEEGFRAASARDGAAALELTARGAVRPDLILADFNLPDGMNGLQVTAKLRAMLRRQIPVIILTGDISTETLRNITTQNCVRLNKPVKMDELTQVIQRLLPKPQSADRAPLIHSDEVDEDAGAPIVFVVDDDSHIRDGIRELLEDDGRRVKGYATCEAFLAEYRPGGEACLLIDAYLPGMNGLELLRQLNDTGHWLPAIMITGHGDVPTAVQAMKAGALDFIEKPVSPEDLVASVDSALNQARDATKLDARRENAKKAIASLTARQREVMDLVLAGRPNKIIADELGISQRTVENHRAEVMKKTGAKSVPSLVRLAAAAS